MEVVTEYHSEYEITPGADSSHQAFGERHESQQILFTIYMKAAFH